MEANNKKLENQFFLTWAVSIIAMFGSLYFSEIRQYEPCELCWYQRILMYPMTILLGIAYVKKDWKMSFYAMILSGVGGTISLYHYLLQKVPFLSENANFCGSVSCSGEYINWLGFITIPFLALTAFTIIFIVSFLNWRQLKGEK